MKIFKKCNFNNSEAPVTPELATWGKSFVKFFQLSGLTLTVFARSGGTGTWTPRKFGRL